jgi:hypothetical protein
MTLRSTPQHIALRSLWRAASRGAHQKYFLGNSGNASYCLSALLFVIITIDG